VEQINAINKLYEVGYKAGLLPQMKDVREYMIPKEYKKFRMES